MAAKTKANFDTFLMISFSILFSSYIDISFNVRWLDLCWCLQCRLLCTNQNKIRLIAVDDVTAYNVETVRKMAPVGNQDKWVAEWLCTASYLLAAARASDSVPKAFKMVTIEDTT